MVERTLNSRRIQFLMIFLSAILVGGIIAYKLPLSLLEIFALLVSIHLLFQYPEVFFGLFHSSLIWLFMAYSFIFASVGYWTLIPLVALILYALRKKISPSLLINKLSISQILFALWLLIGLYHSADLSYGIEKTKHFLSWNLFPLIGCMFFIEDSHRMRRVLYSFAIGAILIGLSGYYFYRKGILSSPFRLGVLGIGPIWFGRIAGVASILIIGYLFLIKGRGKIKLVLIPMLILLLFNMILSGTRGVFVAFIIAIFVFFMLGQRERGLCLQILSFVLLIFIVSVVFRYIPEGYIRRYSTLTLYESLMASDRIPLMKSSLEMFFKSPIIGHGTGSSRVYIGGVYSHNIFLEIAAELGLIGLAVFCFFVYQIFRHSFKIIFGTFHYTDIQRKVVIIVTSAFIFYFIEAQFSYDITGNGMLWFFAGLVYSIAKSYTLGERKEYEEN